MTYRVWMDRSTVPVACTLTTKDATRQVLEWSELRGRALDIETLVDGVAMTFPAKHAAAVEDLAAREAACCAFLTITTTHQDGIVRVDITTPDSVGIGVIDMIAGTSRS